MMNAQQLKENYIQSLKSVRVHHAKAATKHLLKKYAHQDGRVKTLNRAYDFVLSIMCILVKIRDMFVNLYSKRADKKIEVADQKHRDAAAERDACEVHLNELQ